MEPFTRIPNAILDDPTLSVHEFRILAHIARKTIGYEKKSDGISLSQFVSATGISKPKVISTLKTLKEEGHIKVLKQTRQNGGNSYSKYSLKAAKEKSKGGKQDLQGVVNESDKGGKPRLQGVVNDVNPQHTIEQHTIRQHTRERTIGENVFFDLTDHEQLREAKRYAKYASSEARNPKAYIADIMKRFSEHHPQTLQVFEEWYLSKSCEDLFRKYGNKQLGKYTVKSIHSYTETIRYGDTDYQKDFNIYVTFEDETGKLTTDGAMTASEMEEVLEFMYGGIDTP